MLSSIHNLREISRRCLTGEQLGEDLAYWLGTSLRDYLERRRSTVDEAFDLKSPRGGVPWRTEEAIRKRNTALTKLAASHLSHLSHSGRARRIRVLSCRYEASAWRFDRERDEMPRRHAGTPSEQLWRAFKSGATMPLSERQLRNILAH